MDVDPGTERVLRGLPVPVLFLRTLMTRGTKHGEESNFGGGDVHFSCSHPPKNYRLLSAYQELSKQYLKRSRWLHNTVTVFHTTELYIQNGQTGK